MHIELSTEETRHAADRRGPHDPRARCRVGPHLTRPRSSTRRQPTSTAYAACESAWNRVSLPVRVPDTSRQLG